MTLSIFNAGVFATLALGLASSGNAHLIMKSPVPYGLSSLNNSPLVDTAIGSSSSDFPCKQRSGVYDISQMNNMKVGDQQTLSFTGSASHGGGTCQLAVSLDKEPTANSTWKLIQVYEGGCPVTGEGNDGTSSFTYSIPSNFPNGQATLAWTWYNRVGNREIYMNCAPITVTGGSDSQDYYTTLPNMYIINLPSSSCSSVESTDQIIPNPGAFVVKGDTANKHSSATGAACDAAAAAQTQGISGYQSAASSNGAGAAGSSAAASATAGSSASSASQNGGQYTQSAYATSGAAAPSGMTTVTTAAAVAPTSGAASQPSTSPANGASVSAPASYSVGGASPSATPGSSGASGSSEGSGSGTGSASSGSSGSGTCSTDGAVVCNGSSQFGLCNNGHVVWQAVAAGTTCSNGSIQRRSVLENNPHVRRHLQGAHHLREVSLDDEAVDIVE